MNDSELKIATRVFVVLVMMAFPLMAFAAHAEEGGPGLIPETLRPAAARLTQKGIRPEDTVQLTQQFLYLQAKPETILAAYQVMMQTLENGLPPGPVLNKAFEGAAKKVNPDLIVAAMQKVMNRYQRAYQDVRMQLNPHKNRVQFLGDLAAEGMTAGLRPDSLKEILTVLGQHVRTMPDDAAKHLSDATLLTARDMSRLGISAGVVSETLGEILQSGMDGNVILQFHHDLMQNSRSDRPDEMARKILKDFQNRQKGNQGQNAAGSHGIGDEDFGGSGNPGGSGRSGGGRGGGRR